MHTDAFRRRPGCQDLLAYAAEKKIQVEQTKASPWSIDENLFHTSYESGILENPALAPPDNMFKGTQDPLLASAEPDTIRIDFKARPLPFPQRAAHHALASPALRRAATRSR